ncbi:MAG: TIGR03751 family conjugal transfer lipoprotein [Pseudomonadota bacterium]
MIALTGCASQRVADAMRTDGIDSRELYRQHRQHGQQTPQANAHRASLQPIEDHAYRGYTRHALNEQSQLFKVLPNPKIAIYVFPHLATRDNAPVPGYTTSVTLYARDEYALPEDAVAMEQRP